MIGVATKGSIDPNTEQRIVLYTSSATLDVYGYNTTVRRCRLDMATALYLLSTKLFVVHCFPIRLD